MALQRTKDRAPPPEVGRETKTTRLPPWQSCDTRAERKPCKQHIKDEEYEGNTPTTLCSPYIPSLSPPPSKTPPQSPNTPYSLMNLNLSPHTDFGERGLAMSPQATHTPLPPIQLTGTQPPTPLAVRATLPLQFLVLKLRSQTIHARDRILREASGGVGKILRTPVGCPSST